MIQAQIFVYILILIIAGLIVLFGYRAVTSLKQKSSQISLVQFENKLKNDIETIAIKAGTVKTEKYSLPSGYSEVCFVDLEHINPDDIMNHPLIKDSVESNAAQNVFLIGPDSFETYYIKALQISNYPYFSCHNIMMGTIELQIEGKGDAAAVRPSAYEHYCQNAHDYDLCDGLDIFFGPGYKNECCAKFELCC